LPRLLLLLHIVTAAATTRAMPDIGPSQKVARSEAYATTFLLLSFSLRAEFLVIDSASLVILGSKRKTEDVDFAVTAAALFAFEEGTQRELSHKGIGTSSELYLT